MIILDEEESQQRSSGVPMPVVKSSSNKTDTSLSSSGINTSTISQQQSPPPPPPPYISSSPNPSSPSYPYFHQTAHHPHSHHPHHSQPTSPSHSPTITTPHPGTTSTAVEDHPLVVHYRIQEQELEKRTLKRFFGAFLIALMIVTLSSTFVRIIAEVARSGGRHKIHTAVMQEVIGISESVVLPSRTLLASPTPIAKERILSIAYPPH